MRETEATRTALSAEGSITFKRGPAKLKAQMTVAVELKPDGTSRLRLDVSTDAGNVLVALASNGTTVTVLDLEHRQFLATPAGPGDLAPLNLPALDTRALARLLLTRSPCTNAPSGADETHIEWKECVGGTLLATYAKNDYTKAYLRSLHLDALDTKLDAELFAHQDGFARRIALSGKELDFLVLLDDFDPKPRFDDDLFELSPPPGVRVLSPIAPAATNN